MNLSYFNKSSLSIINNSFFLKILPKKNTTLLKIKSNSFLYLFLHNFTSYFKYKLTSRVINNFITPTLKNKVVFSKYYFIGLGFKMFTYLKKLFVWVGLTHYTILNIPTKIRIYAKKKRIYITSSNLAVLKKFLITIRYIKKRDIYKGKGLLEVKSYKGFTIMKTGKKKQY